MTQPLLWPLAEAELARVAETEKTAYAHPWSLRHFASSLQAGHWMWALALPPDPASDPPHWAHAPTLGNGHWLLGYLVAMEAADEVHLLNITTVPTHRRQGHARQLMHALIGQARQQGAQSLWLEVRQSNGPARALYEALGFATTGVRKGYYPAGGARREDALVMCLPLTHPAP